ncbi:DNA-directed RNA polymerase subunit beta' [Dirofilaria immitis]
MLHSPKYARCIRNSLYWTAELNPRYTTNKSGKRGNSSRLTEDRIRMDQVIDDHRCSRNQIIDGHHPSRHQMIDSHRPSRNHITNTSILWY